MSRIRMAAMVAALTLLAPSAASAKSQALRLLPFPNDAFTVADKTTPTGKRLHFKKADLPANKDGVSIFNPDLNRFDGFSPGSVILAKVPGFDTDAAFRRTKPVAVTDMAQYTKKSAPILVLDAKSAKRQLIWTELDANATTASARLLEIHPGRNFLEGHRYVVVLRGLKTSSGKAIKADKAFAMQLRKPNARYRAILKTLRKARVSTKGLVNAWDFTVASQNSLSGRMLHIRDDAFKQLGDTNLADGKVQGKAPAFQVSQVTDFAPCDPSGCKDGQSAELARSVTGTFTVPCYLNKQGCPTGSSFHYASSKPDALPTQVPGNVQTAAFKCNIPRAATPASPARLGLYGHGLLGKNTEIDAGNVRAMSQEHDFLFCATFWYGMSNEDIPTAIGVLGNLSTFPLMADRLQQGFLAQLYLGRLMLHPQGLASNPAFQINGQPVVDTSHLYYDGNSQGGINGGGLTAVAPDFTRAVLGVPGMNYSVLLPRSTDFKTYALVLYPAYKDETVRPLALDLVQLMWDRGEADGYAQHITSSPLPNTPRHTVLLHPAYGDHQVTTIQAEVEARTIGARGHLPVLDGGRGIDRRQFYDIDPMPAGPFGGSAIVMWDSGPGHTAKPPVTNSSPQGDAAPNADPHEDPRATPAARTQKSEFLKPDGKVLDVCNGGACHSYDYTS